MKSFATTGAGDLYLDPRGSIAIAQGPDAIAEVAAQAVKTLRGELIFDTSRGMPNMDTVWQGSPNLRQYEAALRRRLLRVEGVRAIQSLTASRSGEIFAYVATLRTIYGPVNING